jgi:hypothetical protein
VKGREFDKLMQLRSKKWRLFSSNLNRSRKGIKGTSTSNQSKESTQEFSGWTIKHSSNGYNLEFKLEKKEIECLPGNGPLPLVNCSVIDSYLKFNSFPDKIGRAYQYK